MSKSKRVMIKKLIAPSSACLSPKRNKEKAEERLRKSGFHFMKLKKKEQRAARRRNDPVS